MLASARNLRDVCVVRFRVFIGVRRRSVMSWTQRLTSLAVDQIPQTLPRSQAHSRPDNWSDVLVIGAGPTGLAYAISAKVD
jgi:NADPH-dependent 2,4-dienoyl-CoA reductase/sulfur reductase-like enzyme